MTKRSISMTLLVMGAIALVGVGAQDSPTPQTSHSEFTGEILTVLYVKDLPQSVAFYRDVLGFRFDHYYDHHTGGSSVEWSYDDSPLYAEMWAGPSRFALHLAKTDYQKRVGGSIHYFSVRDVDAHYKAVAKRGGTPSEMIDRPWMRMFSIDDPDGHRLFFQTRTVQE